MWTRGVSKSLTYSGLYALHGFLYNGSTWTTVDSPSAVKGTVANGISGSNIVGYYLDSSGYYHGFLATPSSSGTYSISGTITSGGTGISGVTVTLSGAGSGTTTTDSNGNYTFTGLSNGSYTVTPSKSGYTFTPDNVTINGASQTGDNIMASSGGGSGGGGGLSARAGGYSPAWLIITLISLTLAGGYLMRNRMVLS